jgi:hypothetical protein
MAGMLAGHVRDRRTAARRCAEPARQIPKQIDLIRLTLLIPLPGIKMWLMRLLSQGSVHREKVRRVWGHRPAPPDPRSGSSLLKETSK